MHALARRPALSALARRPALSASARRLPPDSRVFGHRIPCRLLKTTGRLPASLEPLHLKYLEEEQLRTIFNMYADAGTSTIGVSEAQTLLRAAGSDSSAVEAEKLLAALRGSGGGGDSDGDSGDNTAAAGSSGTTSVGWAEWKEAVGSAALPVDRRVMPIYAALTLTFTAQGTQFPVLPQLATSLHLTAADLGLVTSATALARILSNGPAASLTGKVGRRPLLIAGPAVCAIGMAGLAGSSSFLHLAVSNGIIGVGMSTVMAGAGLYATHPTCPHCSPCPHHPHRPHPAGTSPTSRRRVTALRRRRRCYSLH